jgi:flagellar M-ring protein FliF
LVRSAIGFDAKRGDQIEVANLRLADVPVIPAGEPANWTSFLQFTKDDIMRGIELGVMALLGLLAILLVVRPTLRRIMGPPAPQAVAAAAGGYPAGYPSGYPGAAAYGLPGPAGVPGVPGIPGVASAPMQIPMPEPVPLPPPPPNRTASMIDYAQVAGQVHQQSVQKVGELADKNPNETAAIVRAWLHEDAA